MLWEVTEANRSLQEKAAAPLAHCCLPQNTYAGVSCEDLGNETRDLRQVHIEWFSKAFQEDISQALDDQGVSETSRNIVPGRAGKSMAQM